MTDLETLRRALRVGDDPGTFQEGPDVASIMTQGRRLRIRRRVTAAGGALCLAGLVLAVVTGIAHLTRPTLPVPQRPASPGHSLPGPVTTPAPHATEIPQPSPVHSITPPSVAPTPTAPGPPAPPAVPTATPSTRPTPSGPAPTASVPRAPTPSASQVGAVTPTPTST
jgi:hypothetical protein